SEPQSSQVSEITLQSEPQSSQASETTLQSEPQSTQVSEITLQSDLHSSHLTVQASPKLVGHYQNNQTVSKLGLEEGSVVVLTGLVLLELVAGIEKYLLWKSAGRAAQTAEIPGLKKN
ncbi:unnamed protein product, partial [Prunus brigantina]